MNNKRRAQEIAAIAKSKAIEMAEKMSEAEAWDYYTKAADRLYQESKDERCAKMSAVRINSNGKGKALLELTRIDAVNVIRGPIYFLTQAQLQRLDNLNIPYETLDEKEVQKRENELIFSTVQNYRNSY
ncbi:hypothetical protein H8E77_35295 [bacterium]|nr:hypothetical protein [bacterium]